MSTWPKLSQSAASASWFHWLFQECSYDPHRANQNPSLTYYMNIGRSPSPIRGNQQSVFFLMSFLVWVRLLASACKDSWQIAISDDFWQIFTGKSKNMTQMLIQATFSQAKSGQWIQLQSEFLWKGKTWIHLTTGTRTHITNRNWE
jgi:hypothetical protein